MPVVMDGAAQIRVLLTGCLLAGVWPTADAQVDSPLRTRNLNPPVAIFALPGWQPRTEGTVAGVTTEFANHYRLSRRGQDFLLLDGETLRLNLFAEKSLGPVWSVGFELPLIRQYGGILDDVVDAWHAGFNLPDGGRNRRPEDVFEFRFGSGNDSMIDATRPQSVVGDATLTAARRFGSRGLNTLRIAAKLPTGDEALLAGSGAADLAVSVLRNRAFALRRRDAALFLGAGAVLPGTPDLIRLPAEDVVLAGLAGGAMSIRERLGVKVQIEIHTPFYDSPLEEIGQTSVQISAGGWLAFGARGRFDFAISEDLHVSTAPDVVIHGGVQWAW